MMTVRERVPLSELTTFRTGGKARFLIEAHTVDDIREAARFAEAQHMPLYVLGGGSNLLVHDADLDAVVLRPLIRGVEMHKLTDDVSLASAHHVYEVIAGAGEIWDDLVAFTVGQGLYGLENLSFIPGTVGAAPVQNIGAYGIEVKDVVSFVEGVNLSTGNVERFDATLGECHFTYRTSVFKEKMRGTFVVTRVGFRLTKGGKVHLGYKDLQNHFEGRASADVRADEVREAVIAIRKAKLPDVRPVDAKSANTRSGDVQSDAMRPGAAGERVGTAGSFFKNPIITRATYNELAARFPGLPCFTEHASPDNDAEKELVKVPLGWILDKVCGMRGASNAAGTVGTWNNQALVLVNRGAATAADVRAFADHMLALVKEKTGLSAEWEVEWWGK